MSSSILKKHLSCSSRPQVAALVTKKKVQQLMKQNQRSIVSRRIESSEFEHSKSYLELATDEICQQKEMFHDKVTEYGKQKSRKVLNSGNGNGRKLAKSHKSSKKHVNNILKLYKKLWFSTEE